MDIKLSAVILRSPGYPEEGHRVCLFHRPVSGTARLLGVFFCSVAPGRTCLRPLQFTWTDPLLFTALLGRRIPGPSRQIGDINLNTAASASDRVHRYTMEQCTPFVPRSIPAVLQALLSGHGEAPLGPLRTQA